MEYLVENLADVTPIDEAILADDANKESSSNMTLQVAPVTKFPTISI